MGKKSAGQEPSLPECIDVVSRTYETAAELIRSAPDAQKAFEDATELAAFLRDLADKGADLRAEAVSRIWKTEELSVKGLAERIGVSKARADQLLKAAKSKDTATNTKEDNKNG